MAENRGKLSVDDRASILEAGYTEGNVVDMVVLIGDKIITIIFTMSPKFQSTSPKHHRSSLSIELSKLMLDRFVTWQAGLVVSSSNEWLLQSSDSFETQWDVKNCDGVSKRLVSDVV